MRNSVPLVTGALLALSLTACATDGSNKPVASNTSVTTSISLGSRPASVEASLRNDATVSRFADAARATGVAATLSNSKPVTVFAPDNAALESALQAGNLMRPDHQDELARLVNCHVMSSDLTPGALSDMIKQNGGSYPVITAGGCVLTATQVHNVVTLTDENGVSATLTHGRKHQGNGMIYKVDKVFMPKGQLASLN